MCGKWGRPIATFWGQKLVVDGKLTPSQGAYNSGKHGNLREFVNSGKFRENSGNLQFTQGIYQMLLIVI